MYMYLVIPSYVPLDRLATASGMQMILNGIFLLVGGPLIGKIIFSINIVSIKVTIFFTFLSFRKYKNPRRYNLF